jgi:hypothetical protein
VFSWIRPAKSLSWTRIAPERFLFILRNPPLIAHQLASARKNCQLAVVSWRSTFSLNYEGGSRVCRRSPRGVRRDDGWSGAARGTKEASSAHSHDFATQMELDRTLGAESLGLPADPAAPGTRRRMSRVEVPPERLGFARHRPGERNRAHPRPGTRLNLPGGLGIGDDPRHPSDVPYGGPFHDQEG